MRKWSVFKITGPPSAYGIPAGNGLKAQLFSSGIDRGKGSDVETADQR